MTEFTQAVCEKIGYYVRFLKDPNKVNAYGVLLGETKR